MSTMRNSVMLIGRLGADPEIRSINNSKRASFRLAVNEGRKNDNGEWVENTQWFPVVAWGAIVDRIEKTLSKGMQVAVGGSLHNNEWTDDKGQRHLVTEIWISDFFLMEKPKE